jgi:uncharacterized RDD family membrane protein YckC
VKCPKCSYLGFETGDRCKHCGYDFSLMAASDPERIEIDLDLREEPAPAASPATLAPESPLTPEPPPVLTAPARIEDLPLFTPSLDAGGDEPLIKVPSAPRPPLAVRRTPDTPRLRALSTPARRTPSTPAPSLRFESDGEAPPEAGPAALASEARASSARQDPVLRRGGPVTGEISAPGARAGAAAIDLLMLGGIDVAVVYFTLRMSGLAMDQWAALPAAPLFAFLLLIKLSYFYAFTVVGGQTIGKMATHIRVVADGQPLDAALALRRTLAGVLSVVPLGLGFLPALFGSDRRALHDRVARTRVIALKSA